MKQESERAGMVATMSQQQRIEAFIQEMPKAELHVHLEGAVLPTTLLSLAGKHGVDLPAKDLNGIREFYTFTDFDHFVRVYMKINDCLVTPEDVGLITEELGNDAARQNIRYLEVTISPGTLVFIHGTTFDEILREINAVEAQDRGIVALGALEHSFLPESDREAMMTDFRSEFGRLRTKFALDEQ